MTINHEIDPLLGKARSTLAYLCGSLAQARDGLDGRETNGLAAILTDLLESLEKIHTLILEASPGGSS